MASRSQARSVCQSDPNTVESSLNNPTTAKPSLRHRATEELKELLILSLYLYVCLGALIIMKSAILNSVGVEFDLWGIAAIKALLLAKFMLIGKALHLGEKKNMPLAWPTLYQSAAHACSANRSDHAGGNSCRCAAS